MEILDLVSEEDRVIGRMTKCGVYEKKLCNFRTVNAFIMNDAHELWIPTRHHRKALNPNMLDASVAGHVKSGESYDEAILRETHEEARLDLNIVPWKMLGKLSPYQDRVGSFMQVYLIWYNGVFNFNTKDFSDYMWVTLDDFHDKIKSGMAAKYDLSCLIHFLKRNIIYERTF